jgi:predicted secreted protein
LGRLAASLILFLLSLAPALAGDRALINFIGYSEDHRYFAFEEFGEHDGSGGVYSSIQVVDLQTDKWMYGSPFTVDVGSDMQEIPPLADVRAQALAKAADKLKELKIGVPAEVLYLLGDGMGSERGKVATFSTPNCCAPGSTEDDAATLVLGTMFAKPEGQDCAGEDIFGFELNLIDDAGKHTLHKDGDTVPKSRGCPTDYRLYAVLAPMESFGPRVAIVSMYPRGFEGPDRRFLLVPIDTP